MELLKRVRLKATKLHHHLPASAAAHAATTHTGIRYVAAEAVGTTPTIRIRDKSTWGDGTASQLPESVRLGIPLR